MAQKYLAPDPVQSTFFIPGGAVPGNGVQVFVYQAGTTTKTTVYKDDQGVTAWSNPIVLDSGGNLPSGGSVWLTQGETVKFVWAPSNDTDPPASPYRTLDDVTGLNDVTVTGVEWLSGSTPTFVSATSLRINGDVTSTYVPGRRIRTTNTGGTIYSTILNAAHATGTTTVFVQNDSGSLDSGLSAVAYGLLSGNNVSVPQATPNAQVIVTGRLTVLSANPVATSDVIGTNAVYFTPYKGNVVSIYDGSQDWVRYSFSEVSTAIPDATRMNDVFIYNNGSTLALTTLAWTNDTTRATAISSVSGVPTRSGDATQLYLGSFFSFSTSAGTSQSVRDTQANRHLWNYWNREPRVCRYLTTTTSYNYTSAGSVKAFNESSTNALGFVVGVDASVVQMQVNQEFTNNNASTTPSYLNVGLGLDSVNTTSNGYGWAGGEMLNSSRTGYVTGFYHGHPGPGRHALVWSLVGSQSSVTCQGAYLSSSDAQPQYKNGIFGVIDA